jgi:transmembrane sensor
MSPAEDERAAREAKAQARAWWVRLRSGRATPDDADAYRRWCAEHPEHDQAAHEFSDAWSALNAAAAEVIQEQPDTARGWRASAGRPHVLRPGRRAFVGFALAAGASWLALRPPLQLWPALGEFAADYRTGTGEQRQVALSDRVVVEMNTQTRINLVSTQTAQAGGAGLHGIDLLAGEAEIVARMPSSGRTSLVAPVVVTAGRGRVQALVAQFNVRRTDNQVCVTCVSGSITVEHPQRRLTLLATQQVVFDDREVHPVSQVDLAATTAWRQGLLVFRNVPLAQVVEEINRYRPGKVILRNPNLGTSKVQAQVSIGKIDDAVVMLAKLYDLRVVNLPGDIALLS